MIDNSGVEDYFRKNRNEIEIPDATSDIRTQKEKLEFFSGNLNEIDIWLKHEEFRLKKANSDSERQLREKNARLAFRFATIWASFIGLIILLKGFDAFKLSQTEFLFVIGSLTASIFAFYLLVLKYLFYRPGNELNQTEKKE